jgi:hypothetical protein
VNPPDSDSHPGRLFASRALVVLASLAVMLALVAAYARQAAVDSNQFANRATVALHDDSVRSLIAQKVTDELVLKNEADLIAARPIIESVASEIVGGRAFTSLFRKAVRDLHRALFKRDRNTVTLTLTDVGTVVAAALAQVRPALADQLQSTQRVELVTSNIGSLSARLADIAETVELLALFLVLLSLVLVAGAIAVAPDRRQAVVELGVGASVAGVLLVVAYSVARSIAVGHVDGPDEQAAARAVWHAFLGDLRTAAWILAISGAAVAAAAASLIKPAQFGEPLRVAVSWVSAEPRRPVLRVLRAAAFVAAGIAVLVEREAVLFLLLTVLGIYLIYEGLSAVLRLVYRPEEHEEEEPEPPRARAIRRRRLATGLAPAVLIAVVVALFLGSGGTTTAAPAKGPCNGRIELCERRLDRVALPATHNSMSVPLPGWYSSEQERPIIDQLSDGIRGLLIDTHYGDRLQNGKVRTSTSSSEQLRQQAQADGVSDEALAAAVRLRDRLGFQGKGERGMYLCHSFCELGATRLDSVLEDLRTFLVANPGAVLVVINQDYVTPDDFVGAVRDAGLEQFAYTPPASGRWPTLRRMVDSGKRVVFLAENEAGGAAWYQLAYESITEETPYAFTKVARLINADRLEASCAANRGPEGAPVFLLNHWITTDPVPLPSNAARVNAYDALLERARECQRIRGHLPNLVAVNFYREGDLFRAVDTLNRLR